MQSSGPVTAHNARRLRYGVGPGLICQPDHPPAIKTIFLNPQPQPSPPLSHPHDKPNRSLRHRLRKTQVRALLKQLALRITLETTNVPLNRRPRPQVLRMRQKLQLSNMASKTTGDNSTEQPRIQNKSTGKIQDCYVLGLLPDFKSGIRYPQHVVSRPKGSRVSIK